MSDKQSLPKLKRQKFLRFADPIVKILRELGGSGSASEVTERIIEAYDIPQDELDAVNKNGGSRVKNQIAWARFYLLKSGYIGSSARGIWNLTEKSKDVTISPELVYSIFDSVQATTAKRRSGVEPEKAKLSKEVYTEKEPEEFFDEQLGYKEQVIDLLQNKLSANGFERLCQRLLRESGFSKVEVTGKTNDGGIDGIGLLQINPFLSQRILFQCKRWKNPVPPKEIRDFRGAMDGRADKGIFLTTGTFSNEAKKESTRDGARQIELVDVEKIVEMLEELHLGLLPRKDFEVDYAFFEEFAT